MRLPSSNTPHSFSMVPHANIERSSFDRSHNYKTSLNAGLLIPFYCDEVLPGDTFSLHATGFARLSTPLKPIMDNAYFNTFFFFVPNRLIWQNWEKFNGQQDNPGDSTDFLVPQVEAAAAGGFAASSFADYIGLPTGVASLSVCAFWHRAYNLIWNEWFRDQNLQDRAIQHNGDGPDSDADYPLRRRGKRHDYFTASLPWPQKGESVDIPLGGFAPVTAAAAATAPTFKSRGDNKISALAMGTGTANALWQAGANPSTVNDPALWENPNLHADLSSASAATINQLRQAFAMQQLLERDARGGTRYTEIVRSHFGVVSPDARLQRPEYLGGGQSPILVSQIPQTSATAEAAGATPQGNLAAFGTAALTSGHGFHKSFTEHGVILGLVSVRADLNYQQGLDRKFSRKTRWDFYWPPLAHIGEQAVLSKEIFCDGTAADETVWGYQERYGEYRYHPSKITGELRSSYPQSLDIWHLAQDFAARPLLNSSYIEDNPPFERVVAVPSEPTFIFDCSVSLRCARPMPVYGVPGMTRL